MNKLSVKKISKSYNSSQVVSNVSIEVNTGEIIGLLGPNGAGKTVFPLVPILDPTLTVDGGAEQVVDPLGPQTAGIPPPKPTDINTESPQRILVSLTVKVISGEYEGTTSIVRVSTFTQPIALVIVTS